MPKRVVITGANKGIGRATVAAVLKADAETFVFLGSRDQARGEAAREALIAEDASWAGRIAVVALDVSSDASVAEAKAAVTAAAPGEDHPLYGVINNAGMGFGDDSMARVLDVNTRGPHRVTEAFLPLIDPEAGRVVMVSSASGPNFVAKCSDERQKALTNPDVTWDEVDRLMAECVELATSGGDFAAAGLGGNNAYGLSKACLNAYTMHLARRFPKLTINACTPGFIETDLTRPYAENSGKSPAEMGMKSPADGSRASVHLLLGEPGGSGWYFGSDAQRSPIDRYRSPGDPPYTGD